MLDPRNLRDQNFHICSETFYRQETAGFNRPQAQLCFPQYLQEAISGQMKIWNSLVSELRTALVNGLLLWKHISVSQKRRQHDEEALVNGAMTAWQDCRRENNTWKSPRALLPTPCSTAAVKITSPTWQYHSCLKQEQVSTWAANGLHWQPPCPTRHQLNGQLLPICNAMLQCHALMPYCYAKEHQKMISRLQLGLLSCAI